MDAVQETKMVDVLVEPDQGRKGDPSPNQVVPAVVIPPEHAENVGYITSTYEELNQLLCREKLAYSEEDFALLLNCPSVSKKGLQVREDSEIADTAQDMDVLELTTAKVRTDKG